TPESIKQWVRWMQFLDRWGYITACLSFLIVGMLVFGYSWFSFVQTVEQNFLSATITLLNDLLFVIILLELFRTVLGFLQHDRIRLEPFLAGAKHGPRFPRCDMLIQAAIHGQGMALVWNTMVGNELTTGRLVKPLQGRFETTNAFYAVSTPEIAQKAKTRAFREWMITQAQCKGERDPPYGKQQASVL
ncbi:MAG: LysR substrate-binding domain-containing protein, partial [Acidiferrobacterales bacterium]